MPELLVLFAVAATVTIALVGTIYTLPYTRADYDDSQSMTLTEAHTVMQLHRRCNLNSCDRKLAAARTLYNAGHFIPDRRIEGLVR
ncbi:hypothetical protein [Nocardia donostiensis]|uniref:Uncharacterized protein n=1 Tax=Nocardia donostiensis TaxID=1538463 RepID=A0A1W0B6I8_9NOCA|nr:hypothetical protein [Nocardia donostiensis]ONM46467.1 hypothetical protein B0T46_22820 [Nocardia donostiensis]OQS18132.1 hypothetical protein B0T44_21310 [Nocardia donostiensis]